MKITKDSPILTNYLLGEVSPAEKLAVESAMQADPEIRSAVENLKSAVILAKSLNRETSPAKLSEAQRNIILSAAKAKSESGFILNWKSWGSGLLAASLALVIYINNRNQFNSISKSKQITATEVSEHSDMPTPKKAMVVEGKTQISREVPQKQAEAVVDDSKLITAPAPSDMAQAKSMKAVEADSAESIEEEPPSSSPPSGNVPTALSKTKNESLDFAPPTSRSALGGGSAASSGAMEGAQKRPSLAEAKRRVVDLPTDLTFDVVAPIELKENVAAVSHFTNLTKSCFTGAFSRYVKYEEEISFRWTVKNNVIERVDYSVNKASGHNFENNLNCVLNSIRSSSEVDLPRTPSPQIWRLIMRSK